MQNNHSAAQVLDQMHQAILQADFALLAGLAPALETAVASLGRSADASSLQAIQHKAARNAACLVAAGRGVRSAMRRLAEVQGAGTGLITYDGAGKRASHATPGQLARRF